MTHKRALVPFRPRRLVSSAHLREIRRRRLGLPRVRSSRHYNISIDQFGRIIKTPKGGVSVNHDFVVLKALGELAPKTELSGGKLIQEAVPGRFATEQEIDKVKRMIRKKGFWPRGLTGRDVIVTPGGSFKVVDVVLFKRIPKGREKSGKKK